MPKFCFILDNIRFWNWDLFLILNSIILFESQCSHTKAQHIAYAIKIIVALIFALEINVFLSASIKCMQCFNFKILRKIVCLSQIFYRLNALKIFNLKYFNLKSNTSFPVKDLMSRDFFIQILGCSVQFSVK